MQKINIRRYMKDTTATDLCHLNSEKKNLQTTKTDMQQPQVPMDSLAHTAVGPVVVPQLIK